MFKATDVSAGFACPSCVVRAGMPGPGTALQLDSGLKKGRLLVPSHHGAYESDTVTVSDDGGKTWRTIPQVSDTNTCKDPASTELFSCHCCVWARASETAAMPTLWRVP